jgi:CRISPR/Cas system-associated endonuclease Cas1
MKEDRTVIFAKDSGVGLDIFVKCEGEEYYLTSRRRSEYVQKKLKSGVTLGELRRVKPQRNWDEQQYYHYAKHLLKLADGFVRSYRSA